MTQKHEKGFWRLEDPLVLASMSRARQMILREAGIPFTIQPANIDEREIERDLNLKSENSKEAHAFSLGKEFMLMQLAKDVPQESFIHDRGILTVLVWGLLEGRITEEEARNQIEIVKKYSLLDEITIIYINGENPDKSDRSKDQWDHIDGDSRERDTYEKVISMFQEAGLHKIWVFENKFNDQSVSDIASVFEDILFN